MSMFVRCKREDAEYKANRVEKFCSDKKDVYIYEWNGRYVVALINAIEVSDRIYSSMTELLEDSMSRGFYIPYNMTKRDYERLDKLKKYYMEIEGCATIES